MGTNIIPIPPTHATNHPLEKAIQAYQAAVAQGGFDNACTIFEPDVTNVVPGHNQTSATLKGPDAVMDYFGTLMRIANGTYAITDMKWLVQELNKVALVTQNYADINGKTHAWGEVTRFEMRNGRKHHIEMYQEDQAALDAFYG